VVRHADIELLIHRDVPAIGAYHLDSGRPDAVFGQLVVTPARAGEAFTPTSALFG
jgi:hypothetical protein